MGQKSQTYRYRVDAGDLLVWVDEWWLAFAQENGAAALTEELVLGRSIWDFVAGDVTRRLFSALHERVRLTGKIVVLPFRCDSPSLQRHMRLTITLEEPGQLLYESVLIRVEPQRDLCVLEVGRQRSECFLTMCSCCKRALLESTGWLEVEDISVRLRLFDTREVPELRYTVCPECAQKMTNSSNNGNAA
jgi:hypothetical protein